MIAYIWALNHPFRFAMHHCLLAWNNIYLKHLLVITLLVIATYARSRVAIASRVTSRNTVVLLVQEVYYERLLLRTQSTGVDYS